MKKNVDNFNIVNSIILFVLIIMSIIVLKFIIPTYFNDYAIIANLITLILITAVAFSYKTKVFVRSGVEKAKTVLIIVIIANLLYFLLGIFVGYMSNPYSFNIIILLKNIFLFVGITALEEYIRTKLIRHNNSLIFLVGITILFFVYQFNFYEFIDKINTANNEVMFEYIVETVLPLIGYNILCTYLSNLGGGILNYAYSIPMTLLMYILPIFPNTDWFVHSSFRFILIVVIITYLNYEERARDIRFRRERKKKSKEKNIVSIACLSVFVLFVAGILPYKPIAIMSNSMNPTFKRGSLVISKKIGNRYSEIKEGDILEFKSSNGVIVHRVVAVNKSEDGKYTFITKGDANKSTDNVIINENQVIGVAKAHIPYLGYPSVLVAELIFKKDNHINIE